MQSAFSANLQLDGVSSDAANVLVSEKAVYVPHIYRGGWVIRGFGYSVDRIGVYVTQVNCGNPELV